MTTGHPAPRSRPEGAPRHRFFAPTVLGLLALAGPALANGGWSITSMVIVSQQQNIVLRGLVNDNETASVRSWSKETSMGPRVDTVREDRTEAGLKAEANFEDLGTSWEVKMDIEGELAVLIVHDNGSWSYTGTTLDVSDLVEPAAVALVAEADRYTPMTNEAIGALHDAIWDAYNFQ